jgi:hypothetical protein
MAQLVIACTIMVVAVGVAAVLRRRRSADPPSQPLRPGSVPAQLDRNDFSRPEAPWLVAVFTSATCDACGLVRDKAVVLESDDVAVAEIEYPSSRATHDRYGIDAVPTLVIADHHGVVRRHFVGPVTATDLWAAVAEVRSSVEVDDGGVG